MKKFLIAAAVITLFSTPVAAQESIESQLNETVVLFEQLLGKAIETARKEAPVIIEQFNKDLKKSLDEMDKERPEPKIERDI